MAFCANCGTKIEEGIKFCPGCGKALAGSVSNPVSVGNHEKADDGSLSMRQIYEKHNEQQTAVVQPRPTADEMYCFSCGSVIKKIAEICPKCGVRQDIISTAAINAVNAKAYDYAAVFSLVVGIVGLVLAILTFLFPPFFQEREQQLAICLMLPIFGLVHYIIKGRKSAKKSMATAGFIVCIVGSVAAISLFVIELIR